MKYFSAFPHLSLSRMVIIPCYELFYAITFSIRVINLNFISISSGILLKRNMLGFIQVGLSNPTPDIKKAMTEAEVTAHGRYQHNISI